MATYAPAAPRAAPRDLAAPSVRGVIFAASLGTVFERCAPSARSCSGGAATYVAEHAPDDKRGSYTARIQTTATLGLFLSLLVILGCRVALGTEQFEAWGWRVPFLVSLVLLGVSTWIRLKLNESPLRA